MNGVDLINIGAITYQQIVFQFELLRYQSAGQDALHNAEEYLLGNFSTTTQL